MALLLRKMIGSGTPRAMQDAVAVLFFALMLFISAINTVSGAAALVPTILLRRMPHRNRFVQQKPTGRKSTF
ncbi:MAG: hypothetical protein ACRD2U_17030 [Terriglobales bacterium]